MQALSMIDTSVNPLETVVPAKPTEPKGKQFGKVLNEQRQPEQTQAAETKQQPAQKQEVKQEVKQAAKSEQQPEQQSKVEQQGTEQVAGKQEQAPVQATAEVKPKLQQTIMNLMKVIAGGETPELVEEFGSTEELLNQLVQQLEGTELKGEQVLAGIDLSALVEQLQDLSAEGGEEQLAQLVVQIEEQLANEEGLLANAELAAVTLPITDPQATAPKLAETVAQARQILQKAIDSVAPKNQVVTQEVVVAEEQATGEELLLGEEAAEEIDPRFAGLLKPRTENRVQQQQSLRQQVQGNSAKPNTGDAAQVTTEVTSQPSETVEVADLLGTSPKQGLESLLQQAQGQAQPVAANQTQNVAGKVLPTTPMVQLPSGQQVAESQIFDQVVARFSSSLNGDSKRMVLRMQPAELGSLRIELQVDGDRLRANLLAQTTQVQEVLERNLPQLRSALAEQGLKIDQFQVDVNKDQSQQDQFDQMAQQQQRNGSQSQPSWKQPWETEEQVIPVAHLMQNGGGGISLHV